MEKVFDPVFKPIVIEVDVEARVGRVLIEWLVGCSGEPIRNPVTGAPHRALTDLPDGMNTALPRWGAPCLRQAARSQCPLNTVMRSSHISI